MQSQLNSSSQQRIKFPTAARVLFDEKPRYICLFGGRGSGKSWSIARALLLRAANKPLRILCARELQNSIGESVHKLLSLQIDELGLSHFYTVQQQTITGLNGSEFIFAGLKNNTQKLKSYESVSICWIEEAQSITQDSWEILTPTIRMPGSQIICSFNPVLQKDFIYQYFIKDPPDNAVVVKMNYTDNPWFGEPLLTEMRQMQVRDPDGHANVWLGKPREAPEGAIIARAWWQPWLTLPQKLETPDEIIISLDTAYTEKQINDPSACTVWYLMGGQYTPPLNMRPGDIVETPDLRAKMLLRFAWNERLEFNDLLERIEDTVHSFGLPGVPLRVLVEAKASGISIVQELRRRKPELLVTAVPARDDKVTRANSVTALFRDGRVYAMARDDGAGPEFRLWAEAVIDQCSEFPMGKHDDLVDSCVHALRFVRDQGVEFFAEDVRPTRMRNTEPIF